MGMTIDFATEILKQYKDKPTLINEIDTVEEAVWLDEALEKALDTMRKYKQLQAEYENRIKADMVAMLTDIQLEIKELWDNRHDVWLDNQYYIGKSDTLEEVDEVIQQKIDVLKEESDD